jgi:hypothetical protein
MKKLNSKYVVGLCDAEGSFVASVYKRVQLKTG